MYFQALFRILPVFLPPLIFISDRADEGLYVQVPMHWFPQ